MWWGGQRGGWELTLVDFVGGSPDEHGGESGISCSIDFFSGCKRDVKMGHLFLLSGKADEESRCAWR